MKTAVDSSVLLDVLLGDPVFGGPSREALREAYDRGALVACEVVWAEVRAQFAGEDVFSEALRTLGVAFDALTPAAAALAGQLWRDSRKAAMRSRGRDRVVADFLVGAHAQVQAERLLTRDDGFYRKYFRGMRVVAP
ncbi:MAG: VapC toxin family PIN domain ribonuclease [Acidobacteria bacterium]|nr:MAG: VapC toxin family PIN domain ribonuclease [Acidobacteriota bacterium]